MKNDLESFIAKRKGRDTEFARGFESGYQEFKIGVMLCQPREDAGVTQAELAQLAKTKNSAIGPFTP